MEKRRLVFSKDTRVRFPQGRTQEEAKKNLLEVIRIQFKEMEGMNTLKDYLLECGYEIKDDDIIPLTEMVQYKAKKNCIMEA